MIKTIDLKTRKCFLCGEIDTQIHPVYAFNTDTFKNIYLKLLFRRKKNFMYNHVQLSSKTVGSKTGYHASCYKKVTSMLRKYKEEYGKFCKEHENDEPIVRSERYSLMEDEDWRTRGGSIWNQSQERTGTRVKCRATTCQLVQLVKFMEKHPQLAVSHSRPFPGSDELWMELAEHINQFGPPKNYRQCKTTWRDLRKRAFAMQRSRNKNGTGRNLYGMAPKIISLIMAAGGTIPKGSELGADEEDRNKPKKRIYKSCFVPTCNNTTINAPKKIFFNVPNNDKKRKKWCKAIGKDGGLTSQSSLHCCEDHFDVEDDTKNYKQYIISANDGGPKKSLHLKYGVFPHKNCQLNRDQQRMTDTSDSDDVDDEDFCVNEEPAELLNETSSASSSKPADSPPPDKPTQTTSAADSDVRVERTSGPSGDQLVIRVTDKLDSKTNVFNRFTISDGHFENNITVKEEVDEKFAHQEEAEVMEEDEPEDAHDTSEEMFPQPEAILGDTDNIHSIVEEKNSVMKDLNDTLRKFLSEYKTRNALMRERIDLERARLQFDMEVYRNRQVEKRASENTQ